jgi:DNA-binding NarL/FixJ family response regulator
MARILGFPTQQSTNLDFREVRTLLAVENPIVRQGLNGALRRNGFEQITETTCHHQTLENLDEQELDLIIANTEMNDHHLGQIIREMRHQRFGKNPFSMVIMLSPSGDSDYIRHIIDCGPDDVLLLPVSPEQMVQRIGTLVRNRRRFVITADYIGPDRRKEERPGSQDAPMVDVPNPVKSRIERLNRSSVQRDHEAAEQQINTLKVGRNVVQLRWLIERLTIDMKTERWPNLQHYLNRLITLCEDTEHRTKHWINERIQILVADLHANVTAILSRGDLTDQDVARLNPIIKQMAAEVARILPSTLAAKG